MQRNAFVFLKRFFASPSRIGAITPTSGRTARMIAKMIPEHGTVLEIGSGTGAIAKHILNRISDPSLLTCVESDTILAKELHVRFPSIRILDQDAKDVLAENTSYDAIVSGIPFANFSKQTRIDFFKRIRDRLRTDGVFIMFQYSLISASELNEVFGNRQILFSPINIPPAFVFVCKKQ